MAKLRDKFWVWGHPEKHYNHRYGNEEESRMTPLEGAMYMGARNMFMVPVGEDVNRRQYNKSFVTLDHVGWSINNAADDPTEMETLFEQAKSFPNITCGVFDDFYGYLKRHPLPPERYSAVRERMHSEPVRPLTMWMVLYTREFGINPEDDAWFQPYIDAFDGIIMWTWEARDLDKFEEKFKKFKAMTPHKRRMLGLYLYNFGESKPATATDTIWQLERYTQLLRSGEIEGIVLHTNTMADLDHPSYDVEREWMLRHGDEDI